MTQKPSCKELEKRVKELEELVLKGKGIEQELVESNRLLKEVQRVARIGSWLYDPVTDVLTWSEEMYDIFGLPHQAGPPLYGDIRTLIHPDDWAPFNMAVTGALRNGTGYSLEIRIIRPSGDLRYLNIRGYAEKDDKGTIKRFIGTTQDITESKRSQEALLVSEERYRALFDNIPINTVVVDRKGKITAFRFPEHEEQILKPAIGDVMYVDFAKYPHMDMYRELMESMERGTEKEYLDLRYGDKFLHIRINPYKDGAIITAIDTTSVRKLESELQHSRKMESLGTLAGGIAHEFNNILGIILGNAELAVEYIAQKNPASECVKEIMDASLRAKDVVRQIMSFARRSYVEKRPMLIASVIRDSVKLIASTIPRGIRISEKILCHSEVILGNKTEVGQIIMNLCKNSEQAIKGGVGEIEVLLEPLILDDLMAAEYENLSPGSYIRRAIKDTGEGIAPEIMDRIFEPYFTTKEIDEGLGMGLAVVYGIIKKYDGAIRIKSEPGKGTTVEVLFPVSETKVDEIESVSEILPKGSEHILFVDDEPSLVRIAGNIMEQQGYRVTGLTSSMEALNLFIKEPDSFDLIISDISMPDLPGDALVREIHKIRPEIPVILSSGQSDPVGYDLLKELSVVAFAMKPLKRRELIRTVRDILDKAGV
ncbi:MAG: response regulator [Deltaproteobacteria bacterium]|nr:response regulator [Deltaproteobacteria bacterium]